MNLSSSRCDISDQPIIGPSWRESVPDGFDHAEAHLHAAVGVVLSGLR